MFKYHDMYVNPIDGHVGGRLRMKLAEKAMDHTSLGLEEELLEDYMEGYQRIGAARLFELSMQLEVPVMYFFEGFEPPYDQEVNSSSHISPQLLISSFYRAKISKRIKVIKTLNIKRGLRQ